MTPLALEVALAVQEELNTRAEEVEELHQKQVERARYEAELARRRYMLVDPDNRLVANTLEAEWNEKLRATDEAQKTYEERRQAERVILDEEQRSEILKIATDFPRVWRDSNTPDRERKRMVRLMLEDVTLTKDDQLTAQVRFKGGAHHTLRLPLPQPVWKTWQTNEEVICEIDALLDHHTEAEIADAFNKRGFRSGTGQIFNARIVARLRRDYNLADRFTRLRQAGMLTVQEMAEALDVGPETIKKWRRQGRLRYRMVDGHSFLFEPPDEDTPQKWSREKSTVGQKN